MTSTEILGRLNQLGIFVLASGQMVQLQPGSKIPPGLLAEVRKHKDEIINELRRPPSTNQELRQLIDHLDDPEFFDDWLECAMTYVDPAERSM